MFFSFSRLLAPAATFDGVHRISFLLALALSSRRIQYVLSAYARKFKYLLFVIKFGRASRMGVEFCIEIARCKGMDRVCRSAETAIFILIATSFFFSHTSSRYIALASRIAVSLFCFSFPVSHGSRGSFWYPCRTTSNILVLPSSLFNPYPYSFIVV